MKYLSDLINGIAGGSGDDSNKDSKQSSEPLSHSLTLSNSRNNIIEEESQPSPGRVVFDNKYPCLSSARNVKSEGTMTEYVSDEEINAIMDSLVDSYDNYHGGYSPMYIEDSDTEEAVATSRENHTHIPFEAPRVERKPVIKQEEDQDFCCYCFMLKMVFSLSVALIAVFLLMYVYPGLALGMYVSAGVATFATFFSVGECTSSCSVGNSKERESPNIRAPQ